MPRDRDWQFRLSDMLEAVQKVRRYSLEHDNVDSLLSDDQAWDAILRNLHVLGEAANAIPTNFRREHPELPWKELRGMRNIVVHEYFGISPEIVWHTIQNDLPTFETQLQRLVDYTTKPQHPWRRCPPGQHFVRAHGVSGYTTDSGVERNDYSRRWHCQNNPSGSAKDVLSTLEIQHIGEDHFGDLTGPPARDTSSEHKAKSNDYDSLIRGWTQYWNDVFKPIPPLDPDLVKALIASESAFDPNANRTHRKLAQGLMQLTPQTIRILNNEDGELKDHLFKFDFDDVYDPSVNICAGIRWLFRKRDRAHGRLDREATWEEAVEEYKDYLRRRLKNPRYPTKGMDVFHDFLAILKGNK